MVIVPQTVIATMYIMSTHKNNHAKDFQLQDCVDYLDQLRVTSPSRHRLLLDELRRELPQAHGQVQAHPPFRHLQESPLGPRAAAGRAPDAGGFTGSLDRWLGTTVKDMLTQRLEADAHDATPSLPARATQVRGSRAAIRADATVQLTGTRHFTGLSLTRA